MRAARPVHFDERLRCYAVVRYQDVLSVLGDPASFSSDWGRHAPGSLLDRTFQGDMVASSAAGPPTRARRRGSTTTSAG